jgi:hypothetical protein
MTTQQKYLFTDEEIKGMEDLTQHLEKFSENMKNQSKRMDELILYILFDEKEY